ncbi:minor cardiolipin synthase ClsB [Paraliobacillus ryukyuensis]|uniref:Cardiolipin synthase n=1 Tax=Paraliobacillus ryukyuensis TaxID=200904 RepID=A0A366EGF9_9BACI|nr:phospholipase D-like domain-containing protein [Paraliobacillus ryukyuensis]RBP00519.1 cardiolipin synthase [Paraliobacillus ryukyuensis]
MRIGILLTLIILALGIWLDFKIGDKMMRKQAPVFSANTSSLREWQLITEGNVFYDVLFEDILHAKRSIKISFFIIENDSVSQKFFNLLQEKAMAGIQVYLLMDWIGCFKVKRKYIKQLKQTGVLVKKANPPKLPFFFYRLNQRNHRKVTVIDDEITYFGGFNIGKEYLGNDHKLGHWRDYHLRMQDDTCTDAINQTFNYDWDHTQQPKPKSQSEHRIACTLTITEAGQLEENVIEWINQASNSITIASPYFIPTKRIFSSLMTALRRGVGLTILVPKKADHPFVKGAALPFFKKLIQQGASIYYYRNGFYHTKVLLIDETWCDIGTANFDQRSFLYNQEINLVTEQDDLLASIKHSLAMDKADSSLLTEQSLKKIPLPTKISSVFSRMIRPFL